MARGLLVRGAMTFRLIVIAVILASSPIARGEPEPERRVGFAIRLGGLSHVSGVAMLDLDGAWRRGGEIWLRAAVAAGVPVPDVSGRALEVRVGLEHRREACGRGCFYAGVDLALFYADVREDPDQLQARGLLAIPRGGIDVGSDVLRFRLGFELLLGAARVHDREPDLVPPVDMTTTHLVGGYAFTTGVAAQF